MKYLDVTVDAESALFREWLLPRLEKADVVGLRTGFLTLPGTEAVVPLLRQVLDRAGQVYAVVGGHPEQTDPAALMELARLVGDFPDRAEVYLATPGSGRQNGKAYYARDGESGAAAYVGSANLTRGGLETNHETGIILDEEQDGRSAVEAVLNGIRTWCGHPEAELVTPDVVTAFAGKVKTARIGRSREPGPSNPTWRLADVLPEAFSRIETAAAAGGLNGVSTGHADLDALTNGLQPGSLTVVGGRPSLSTVTEDDDVGAGWRH